MENKKKWMSFKKLADYDYGVKGFEIRFQKMIEDYLKANGIESSWYKFCKIRIYFEILEIYVEEEKEQNCMILSNLHDLYDRVCSDVEENIKAYRKKEGLDL